MEGVSWRDARCDKDAVARILAVVRPRLRLLTGQPREAYASWSSNWVSASASSWGDMGSLSMSTSSR